MTHCVRFTEEIEADEDGLAAGVLIGNAFTDVPDLMSNILVCRNAGSDSGGLPSNLLFLVIDGPILTGCFG